MSVSSQGHTYAVPVYLPPQYNGRVSEPVVVSLHGSGDNGARQMQRTHLEQTAAAHGYIAVAPDGGVQLKGNGHYAWNVPGVGLLGGHAVPTGTRNDTQFLSDLIKQVDAQLCVDTKRVYMMGFSGGARMTSSFACTNAKQVAGIAAVSGLRAGSPDPKNKNRPLTGTCNPASAVSVLAIHGLKDTVNPFNGGGGKYWEYSVQAALQEWSKLDGCTTQTTSTRIATGVTLVQSSSCKAKVELYTVADGGHSWPLKEINATDIALRFFDSTK
jgi:polyhydroxybutyrate depolymerase